MSKVRLGIGVPPVAIDNRTLQEECILQLDPRGCIPKDPENSALCSCPVEVSETEHFHTPLGALHLRTLGKVPWFSSTQNFSRASLSARS
uniref:Uncharacterized protein n=1 Tax=Anguilla anguilla TaxID=7936 RepID=A0A0E9T7D9_ANGAN